MSTETESMKRKRCSRNHGKLQHELECKKNKYDAQKRKYSDVSERQKYIVISYSTEHL